MIHESYAINKRKKEIKFKHIKHNNQTKFDERSRRGGGGGGGHDVVEGKLGSKWGWS